MKKTNNKGFSLVELIIVVAIMAILIGVLAPQYIKYVERSRVAADENIADSLTAAVQSALADEDYEAGIKENDKMELSSTGITPDPTTGDLVDAMDEYFATWKTKKLKSKTYKGQKYTVVVTGPAAGSTAVGFKAVGTWSVTP